MEDMLVELVRSNPVLYDPTNQEYRNQHTRKEAWDKIGQKLGIPESEDSENEGCMGNLSRAIMRPPGHSGKAKKGHLCFDASFETGNLGFVVLISQYEYDLFIRPDTCNPRFRLWFNFTVDNIKTDQRVILNIVNFSKKRNSFLYGMTPIVKSTSRPIWQRMPDDKVFYHSSPYHNNNYVLSLAFNFDKEEDVYQFAFCYPYSYTKCQAHLEHLERRGMDFFRRELLGHSVQKRRIDLLTITHPKNMTPCGKVHVVVIMGRIHPGESPASYVCQGIIDFLVSNHHIAEKLRENVVFKVIPMLNPDGVYLGNHRCSLVGSDLNRIWTRISKLLHPCVYAAYTFLSSLDQDKDMELDIILDIHAHSNLSGTSICGNTYNDVYRYERHIVFPKQLSHTVLGYESSYAVFNRDFNKAGSSRRLLCDDLKGSVNSYSLNVSFYGYSNPKTSHFKYYTEETYFKVGRNVVKAFYNHYKSTSIIQQQVEKIVEKRKCRIARSAIWNSKSINGSLTRSHSAPTKQGNVAHYLRPFSNGWRRKHRTQARKMEEMDEYSESKSKQQPSLSIIDINRMISGGLDTATKVGV